MAEKVSEKEKAIVRALQNDLPLVAEPYLAVAESLGMSEAEFFAGVHSLMEKGQLKRISIALRHKNVGFKVNVMVVWQLPDASIHKIGQVVSRHQAVTHCYERNPREDFPYNFYTMVHARGEQEYANVMQELVTLVEENLDEKVNYAELRSVRELKKIGMKYFLEKPDEMIDDIFSDGTV